MQISVRSAGAGYKYSGVHTPQRTPVKYVNGSLRKMKINVRGKLHKKFCSADVVQCVKYQDVLPIDSTV